MLWAACVPCPVPRHTPQQGLMNAEHESQASSLRALNPLLTHRRGKGGHYDNVQGVKSEGRRGERKEKNRMTMENVLNYKICKMIKQMQVKRKFVGLPFDSFLSFLLPSPSPSFAPLCVMNAKTSLALTNHWQKLTNGAFEVFPSPLPLHHDSRKLNCIGKFRNANEARENVKFTRRVKRNDVS